MQPVCQFCAHYHALDNNIGECRQKPPLLAFERKLFSLHEVTVFPKVARNQWCGKHKEKTPCKHTKKE